MSSSVLGRINWSVTEDKEGHRDYTVLWLVESDDVDDGPTSISNATGLPAVGATWNIGNDNDVWAFCWPSLRIRPFKHGQDPHHFWTVQQTFSTKPLNRCQDTSIENPLNEPTQYGGSFLKYTEEAWQDKDGNEILSSSFEQFRGAAVEFDNNRPTLWYQYNTSANQLSTFAPMIDTVNDATLWGLGARRVKLSNVTWERLLYGTCTYYFRSRYEFDINFNTFDRTVVDQGKTRVNPEISNPEAIDPETSEAYYLNPNNYTQYLDDNDNAAGPILLNGKGSPLGPTQDPVTVTIQKYAESNFLTLPGIPTSL